MNFNLVAWFYIWEHCNDCFVDKSLAGHNNAKFMRRWAISILDDLKFSDALYIAKSLIAEKLKEAEINLDD